ncbi:MAG: iron complex transport system ATP-binding protein [Rickettsiales bacterium]|jgi:iron complex transport system ATP-binding protein
MIEAENISVQIANKKILDAKNVKIKAGKINVILGPNGAGKSTLLKCLTGLSSFEGNIFFGGKNLSDYSLEDLAKKRAVFSQSQSISFPFSAIEIVALGRSPYLQNRNLQQDEKIIKEVLEQVGAWHLKDRDFSNLSGGEQQRIHLARVLVQIWNQKNACLFLDEPTSALDLKHQHQILQIVKDLAAKNNLTICMIIHDINLAAFYADEVILMKDGKIFAFGSKKSTLTTKNLSKIFDIPESYFPQI